MQNNGLDIYSTHNEGKAVIVERFIRTLKYKIYISVSNNMYIDKLDDIVNKYNITYQSTIKIKPADAKSNSYIDTSKEINSKDPKFKIGDIVRTSKYRNIFAKGYFPNWYDKCLWLKKLKTLCCGQILWMPLMEK